MTDLLLSRGPRLRNGKIWPAVAAVALLLLALAVAGCPVQTPVAPTAEVVSPTVSVPPSQAPTATPGIASPAPSPKAAPAVTGTAAPMVQPTATPPEPTPTSLPPDQTGGPSSLLQLKIYFTSPPELGKETTVVLEIVSPKDAPDAEASFDLPEGFTPTAGPLPVQKLALVKNEKRVICASVVASKEGVWGVFGSVSIYQRPYPYPVDARSRGIYVRLRPGGSETTTDGNEAVKWGFK